jgi:hypothetical protein
LAAQRAIIIRHGTGGHLVAPLLWARTKDRCSQPEWRRLSGSIRNCRSDVAPG